MLVFGLVDRRKVHQIFLALNHQRRQPEKREKYYSSIFCSMANVAHKYPLKLLEY
jgi:hypothetical protein